MIEHTEENINIESPIESLRRIFAKITELFKEMGLNQYIEYINKVYHQVDKDTYSILCIGDFASGKTTFVNSLVEEDVLPTYLLPSYEIIKELKYGDEKSAFLYFKNPLPEKYPASISDKALQHMKAYNMQNIPPLKIPCTELKEYTIPRDMDIMIESPYEKIQLYWPLSFLRQGISIVTAEGLNHNLDLIIQYDAIFWVLSAIRFCSMKEMSVIEYALNGCHNIFFIVNRCDCIQDRDKDKFKQFAHMKLDKYTSHDLYFVSAQQALDGKLEHNDSLYEKSGIPLFRNQLIEYLSKDKVTTKILNTACRLKHFLSNEVLLKTIPVKRNMLSESLNDIKYRRKECLKEIEHLKTEMDVVSTKCAYRLEMSKSQIKETIEEEIQVIANVVPKWIDEYSPQHTFGVFPSNQQIQNIVTEIIEYVKNKMESHLKEWELNVLVPLVNEKLKYIFDLPVQELGFKNTTIDIKSIHTTDFLNASIVPLMGCVFVPIT